LLGEVVEGALCSWLRAQSGVKPQGCV
jgi:hypothetical protein